MVAQFSEPTAALDFRAQPPVAKAASIEMEEEILGGILIDPDILPEAENLPPAAFTTRANRLIFAAILEVSRSGLKPDGNTLARVMGKNGTLADAGGKLKLTQLLERTLHSGLVGQYAKLLHEDYKSSSLSSNLRKVAALAESGDVTGAIEQVEKHLARVKSEHPSNIIQLSEFTSASPSSFEETMERVRQIQEIEDEARQAWEMGLLAKSIRAFSAAQLLNIYKIKEQNSKPFNPIDVHEFVAQGTDEREWLIAAHISIATTLVLFADGGAGKSLLAYDLCKAIATGKPWNGFRTRQGKVLIVQTDEPEIDTRERLNIANFAAEIPKGVVQIETKWQFSQMRLFKKWIERERPAFVMIDSFTSANRASDQQEKDTNYASCLYELRDIANQYGCSIMVVHHENKLGGARGTTAIRNNVSEVWRLRKGEQKEGLTPTQRVLDVEKSRSGCSGTFKIELNVEDYSWKHQGDFGVEANFAGLPPLSARLLNHLEARRNVRFDPEELTHEFPGTTKGAIYQHLERHRRKGLINAEERLKQRETGPVRYKVFYAPILDVKVTLQNPETHTENNLYNLYNQPQQPQQVSRLYPPTAGEGSSNLNKNESVEVMSRLDVKVVKVAPDNDLSDSDSNLNITKVETSFLCDDAPTQSEAAFKVGDTVRLPDGQIGSVNMFYPDGRIGVEFEGRFAMWEPSELVLIVETQLPESSTSALQPLAPGSRVRVGNHYGSLVTQTREGNWWIHWDNLPASQRKKYGEPPVGVIAASQIELVEVAI